MTEKEYNLCVTKYADNVYRFIIKNLRHEEDAKDIVQTAFEKLWRNKELVSNEKCKSYLFTIAYHQMIDHIRKHKRIVLQDEFKQDIKIDYQPNRFSKETIDKALNKLNEIQKSLIMLKDYEGYSYDEIGEIMQLNPSQVKVYLHRARLSLRNYIVNPENII